MYREAIKLNERHSKQWLNLTIKTLYCRKHTLTAQLNNHLPTLYTNNELVNRINIFRRNLYINKSKKITRLFIGITISQ